MASLIGDRSGSGTEMNAVVNGDYVKISHRNPVTGEYWVKTWEDSDKTGIRNCWVRPENVKFI